LASFPLSQTTIEYRKKKHPGSVLKSSAWWIRSEPPRRGLEHLSPFYWLDPPVVGVCMHVRTPWGRLTDRIWAPCVYWRPNHQNGGRGGGRPSLPFILPALKKEHRVNGCGSHSAPKPGAPVKLKIGVPYRRTPNALHITPRPHCGGQEHTRARRDTHTRTQRVVPLLREPPPLHPHRSAWVQVVGTPSGR